MTTLIAGFCDEITAGQADAMADHARRLLACTAPVRITLGRVLYHPRAVMLDARPHEALDPVLQAVQDATRLATSLSTVRNPTPRAVAGMRRCVSLMPLMFTLRLRSMRRFRPGSVFRTAGSCPGSAP